MRTPGGDPLRYAVGVRAALAVTRPFDPPVGAWTAGLSPGSVYSGHVVGPVDCGSVTR